MRILVTGATGYLGSRIARMIAEDHNLFVLKRTTSDTARIVDIAYAHADVDTPGWQVRALGFSPDLVVIAATDYGRGGGSLGDIVRTNVAFHLDVLEALDKVPCAVPYRKNELMRSSTDISSLASLGWKPLVPLEEGVA